MRALVEGRAGPRGAFAEHIDLCLGCRGCETVCPSGVPYGRLLEAARVEVARARRRTPLELIERFLLNQVFARPSLLRAAMWLLRRFRESGLARLIFQENLVGGRLRFALALLLASRPHFCPETARYLNGCASSAPKLKVAMLRGCVMEGLFGHVNRATERMLLQSGCQLLEARGQACCGALHAHAGQIQKARELARKNIDAFLHAGPDRIAVNAAGCGAAMKEYAEWLADDRHYSQRARQFSSKVKDISELLVEVGIPPCDREVELRAAYDAPCHLIHAQRVVNEPAQLLSSVRGLQLLPLHGYESCCGGAGIYNLLHPELSRRILSEKIAAIKASGAQVVATGNPGCIMQIGAGLMLGGLDVKAVHPVELLWACHGNAQI
jgi:glycolate oxidase iron-sulfur subunit